MQSEIMVNYSGLPNLWCNVVCDVTSFVMWRHFCCDVLVVWRHFWCDVICDVTSFVVWRHLWCDVVCEQRIAKLQNNICYILSFLDSFGWIFVIRATEVRINNINRQKLRQKKATVYHKWRHIIIGMFPPDVRELLVKRPYLLEYTSLDV